jgi:type IV pilus assembly protein PilC
MAVFGKGKAGPKPPRAPKPPKPVKPARKPAPAGPTVEGEAVKRDWRPAFLQYEKNVKKSEVADAVRSLGLMLSTSRGETGPLATLAEQYKGTTLGSAFERIYTHVQSGSMSMAAAFAEEEKVFPKIVGDLLLVGSRSGASAANLQKAADILDEGQDLTQKIKSALTQPAVLLGIIIIFLYAVILFVLPIFNTMFASFGKPLPPLSKAVIVAGNVLLWVGGAVVVLAGAWTIYWARWGKHILGLRIWLGRAQLKVPVIGKVIRSQRLTQIFSILSGLLSVGMSEREALETAADASGNAAVKDHLQKHLVLMDRGTKDFADLADGFLIPLAAGFMLRNGFDSGAEIQALDGLTTQYRRDANKKAENLTTAIEPIANALVGVIFAAVIISVYLPVYSMISGLTEV